MHKTHFLSQHKVSEYHFQTLMRAFGSCQKYHHNKFFPICCSSSFCLLWYHFPPSRLEMPNIHSTQFNKGMGQSFANGTSKRVSWEGEGESFLERLYFSLQTMEGKIVLLLLVTVVWGRTQYQWQWQLFSIMRRKAWKQVPTSWEWWSRELKTARDLDRMVQLLNQPAGTSMGHNKCLHCFTWKFCYL